MTSFSIDTEAVREIAARVQGIRDEAPLAAPLPRVEFGHGGLAAATASFSALLLRAWRSRLVETEQIAARLRASAHAYDEADEAAAAAHG